MLGQFVYWRMRQAVLRFYRHQWNYGKHFSGRLVDAVWESGKDFPSHDDIESVQKALGRLSEKQWAVYRLLYVEGLTQAAAAKRLGISQQAVAKRNQRLIEQLRRLLGKSE